MTAQSDKIVKSDAEWQSQLTAEEYAVALKAGTERPFTGMYWDETRPAPIYASAVTASCLMLKPNLTQAADGRVFMRRFPQTRWRPAKI